MEHGNLLSALGFLKLRPRPVGSGKPTVVGTRGEGST
jgi:hypothetical protein